MLDLRSCTRFLVLLIMGSELVYLCGFICVFEKSDQLIKLLMDRVNFLILLVNVFLLVCFVLFKLLLLLFKFGLQRFSLFIRDFHHLEDLLFEVPVLRSVPLGRLIDLLVQLRHLQTDRVIELHHTLLVHLHHSFDWSFPRAEFIIVGLIRRDKIHKVAPVFTLIFAAEHVRQFTHQFKLCLHWVQLFVLRFSVICIAHDGDQHVEHGHRWDECWAYEEQVAQRLLGMAYEMIHGKLAQG